MFFQKKNSTLIRVTHDPHTLSARTCRPLMNGGKQVVAEALTTMVWGYAHMCPKGMARRVPRCTKAECHGNRVGGIAYQPASKRNARIGEVSIKMEDFLRCVVFVVTVEGIWGHLRHGRVGGRCKLASHDLYWWTRHGTHTQAFHSSSSVQAAPVRRQRIPLPSRAGTNIPVGLIHTGYSRFHYNHTMKCQ